MLYGTPTRTVVEDAYGNLWTVSTLASIGETIAFEEGGQERQVYVLAPSHAEAVERFRKAVATRKGVRSLKMLGDCP